MIRSKIFYLQNRCAIYFQWVKAHIGIAGNEHADLLAKAASINSSYPETYNKFPNSALKYCLHQRSLEAWEQLWTHSTTGSLTKELFPSIQSRLSVDQFTLDYKITQVLSGQVKWHHT